MKKILPPFLMILIMGLGCFLGISSMTGNTQYIDASLNLAYGTLGLSALLLLISFFISIFRNPKGLWKITLQVVFLGVIILIAYSFSSSEVLPIYGDISPLTSRLSETLIITTYFVLVFSLLALLLGFIKFIR